MCAVLTAWVSPLEAEEVAPPVSIAEARAQFARGVGGLVRVQGQVTFINHWMGLAFVQDATGGIGYDPRDGKAPRARPGDRVEVSGMLARRQGMTMILRDETSFGAPQITALPVEARKYLALPFDLDHATQMRIDGLLTRVSGVVRRVSVPDNVNAPMIVEISSPTGHAIARLPWREPQQELDRWMNSAVSVHSVLTCQASAPLLPQDADALLLVPGKAAWTVQADALNEVFIRPPATLSKEMLVSTRTTMANRLHISGVVTAARPRQWLCMRTAGGSVQVMTRQTDEFAPGDRLSIACWPESRRGMLVMLDGVCRLLGREPVPEPLLAEGPLTALTAMPMELVRARGMVRSHSLPGGLPRLTLLLDKGDSCLLQWGPFLKEAEVSLIAPGSVMDVTGILNPLPAESGNETGVTLAIQPRGAADLVLVRKPSWWTRGRMEKTIWSLVAIVFIAVAVALLSRWQIRRQRVQIRSIEARVIAEEERRRIAREFHDSLQQHLSSAALHLETLKGALNAAPEMLPRLIDDTTAMIRHSQREARQCIWGLRTDAPTHENLAAVLGEWLRMRGADAKETHLHFQHTGGTAALADEAPFQILRIAQEAVNNALAHSGAMNVTVGLESNREEVVLRVADDGGGFDPAETRNGRFGLNSQRERAQKIGAVFEIKSTPGHGTAVTLRVPARLSAHAHASK